MKVLDLQCAQQHVFEGWFLSEDDFVTQSAGALIACPLCGDAVSYTHLDVYKRQVTVLICASAYRG